jgi:signal transduction histidine kinase
MTPLPIAAAVRRLWPRRVRTRLALLYALLFLLAGSSLLALTYALLASRLPNPPPAAKVAPPSSQLLAICKEGKLGGPQLLRKCSRVFAAGARAGSQSQRDRTLTTLLDVSLVGLGIATFASAGLGWVISGRVLRPVRSITETARRASELQLGERLALAGPEDELKELADTFDAMLGRLDAAFASQKRFVANAAHELRTPLTAMHTAIEVTLTKPARSSEQLEAMALRVKRSIQQAEAILEALLTLASTEAGPTASELVDLATAAEDALDAASPVITERRLTIETELDPAPTAGDRVLLERMIANLVDNAVRHNHSDGWIGIRTRNQTGAAVFEIANTGPIVPEEHVPTLFEPFSRATQRINSQDGIGLGLSIANAIATAHGATITAHGRPDGGLKVVVAIEPAGTDVRGR